MENLLLTIGLSMLFTTLAMWRCLVVYARGIITRQEGHPILALLYFADTALWFVVTVFSPLFLIWMG